MSHAAHNSRVSPLFTAQQNGCKAWDAGKSLDDCPYPDLRTDRGSVTWSRSFRRAWIKGWRSRAAGEPGVAV